MSDNDELDAHSTENIAHHNSDNIDNQIENVDAEEIDDSTKSVEKIKNVDHNSVNIDNQMENVDAKDIDDSTKSSAEKTNFSNVNNDQDQWVGSLKSKLNDRRVQFKRKRDSVGYRINPETDEIAKSLVTPADFKFLDEADETSF